MSVLLLVAFCIWRRRSNKTEQCRELSSFVMGVAYNRNAQPTGAMTGNLQEASVSLDGYTSLRFLEVDEGSHDTSCDDTLNINPATKDMTLDPESLQGFSGYSEDNGRLGDVAAFDTHCDDISIIHRATEDMTLDEVIAYCFGVSADDNARLGDTAAFDTNCDDTTKLHLSTEDMTHDQVILHGFGVSPDVKTSLLDVAKLQIVTEVLTLDSVMLQHPTGSPNANALQQVTEDLTLDPVSVQDERGSPHGNERHCEEATLHGVHVRTLDTLCDETSNDLPTTEDGTLDSVRLQKPIGYLDDQTCLGDVGTLAPCRHVTSYPVPGDMTLDPVSLEEKEEDAEYTVIDDNDVEDLLKDDPYETIESVDDNDDDNISQEDPYDRDKFVVAFDEILANQ
ncbi:uncharacterized protein LOC124252710 [Haliotis rubra]|uniref:uncharacterized protein LOC124252710 n=1 Tax=Haliotis rubra TaxID=36100 RepID=UPI001EE636CB|nr:uncharacterized protein LOC124252710 [Haliotis rubra]